MQPAVPGANAGNQPGWNGLWFTAKPTLRLTYTRKRSGNASFGSRAGCSHFSITASQSSLLPYPVQPSKINHKACQCGQSVLLILLKQLNESLLRRLPSLTTLVRKAENLFPHQSVLQYLLHCYLILLGRGADRGLGALLFWTQQRKSPTSKK